MDVEVWENCKGKFVGERYMETVVEVLKMDTMMYYELN